MRYVALILTIVGAATAAHAQDAIPDIKGTRVGKGKVVVFGNNVHNPGKQTMVAPPRVRDIEMTDVVEGQDGRLAWGRSSSAVMDSKEPFAWAISSDNKSIVGADTDGYFRVTLLGPDRMEKCYVHSGAGPAGESPAMTTSFAGPQGACRYSRARRIQYRVSVTGSTIAKVQISNNREGT